ncbi:MAG: TIGR04282 family arsenosugar biosynthesis glycosyltransferase [Flammeovirgaceae bacterium]
MEKSRLLIFVKNPILGKVKTRLAVDIGQEKALEVYKYLLNYTKSVALNLPFEKQVCYDAFVEENDIWDNDKFLKTKQLGNNLGERMSNAFQNAFNEGCQKVVIIGSDCLEITSEIIINAFEVLNQKEAVLGGTMDGGYYLLGLSKMEKSVFEHKKWSSESVFRDTLNDFLQKNMSYYLLPTLNDIDNLNDLKNSKLFDREGFQIIF